MLLFALLSTAAAVPRSVVWAPAAQDLTASVGDLITFSWTGMHGVSQLANAANYDACEFAGAVEVAPASDSGSFTWLASATGSFYFASAVSGDCGAGFKVAVTVNEGTVFTVQMGGAGPVDHRGRPAWYMMNYYPGQLTINAGDTVRFFNPYLRHSATFFTDPALIAGLSFFGPAYGGNIKNATNQLNTALLGPGASFSVHFSEPGEFPYFCYIHPGMSGSITVLPAGEPLPAESTYTQADIDSWLAADLAMIPALEILYGISNVAPAVIANNDGTSTHIVRLGSSIPLRPGAMLSFERFIPDADLHIQTGDTVRMIFSNEIHGIAITNATAQLSLPQWFARPQDPQGSVWKPSADPTQIISSGILLAPQWYDVKFGEAGTFNMTCWLHMGAARMYFPVVVTNPVPPVVCPSCNGAGTVINFNFKDMFP
eukprot:TRINITY_DN1917_c0_g1_i1.p1 TRINITY_DN1917_c0_g1~~TRINITY_DN1917_c0_g1_i1.p1  ORF type:complete len:429 (+),score=95.09 TRINITY_DN1917_c0_g1_i1:39-1325(+)